MSPFNSFKSKISLNKFGGLKTMLYIYNVIKTNKMKTKIQKLINNRELLVVELGLQFSMNGYHEFFINGNIYVRNGHKTEARITFNKVNYYEDCNSGNELILEHFPDLAPLLKVDGCDIFGLPSYCIINTMYYFEKGENKYVKEYLRLTDEEAELLKDYKPMSFFRKLKELSETRYVDEVKEAIKVLEKYTKEEYIQIDFVSPKLYNDIHYLAITEEKGWNVYRSERLKGKITNYLVS